MIGAECSTDGSELPRPRYGYWRSENNLSYIPCSPSEACPGTLENSCAIGYAGNRCAVCSKTYYKLSNRCVPCGSYQSTFFIVLALILVATSALVLFLSRMQKDGYSFLLLGVYVNFIQTIIILRDFRLNWPQEFHTILNVLSFMNFNVELTSPDCYLPEAFNFSFKMKLTLALPLVLVPSVIILFLLYQYSRKLFMWIIGIAKYQDQTSSIIFKVIRVFHMLIILLYTSVTSSSLALFDCTKEADGFYYLGISCTICQRFNLICKQASLRCRSKHSLLHRIVVSRCSFCYRRSNRICNWNSGLFLYHILPPISEPFQEYNFQDA
ncbi:hypothetical protein BKA69DRAFT_697863 [Paraphysoderma sedebokerense]|nr:hypothetical protein BKA69DRAFT_697863 [Paraphysoderma sedebokerense]